MGAACRSCEAAAGRNVQEAGKPNTAAGGAPALQFGGRTAVSARGYSCAQTRGSASLPGTSPRKQRPPLYVSAKRTHRFCLGKQHLSISDTMGYTIKLCWKTVGSFSETNPPGGCFLRVNGESWVLLGWKLVDEMDRRGHCGRTWTYTDGTRTNTDLARTRRSASLHTTGRGGRTHPVSTKRSQL
jgi:hypothetical protein